MSGKKSFFGTFSAVERVEKLLGRAVMSRAGHDSGKIYFIVGVERPCEKDEILLLSDGSARGMSKPKRKKAMHVSLLAYRSEAIAAAIKEGKRADDSVIVHELKMVGQAPEL